MLSAVTGPRYPAPRAYDGVKMTELSSLRADVPWFEQACLADRMTLLRYARDGWLPGGVPLSAVETEAWKR